VACFDTAFHATIPPAAHTYALPASWRERWPLRRFGFHGLSHQYATARVGELTGLDPATLRIVVAHLGAGASLCAVAGGVSVDTTMGFTPLEGLVMQTRSGSIDPGLVLWLIEEGGLSPAEVEHGLEHESGLAGLARGSGDARDVLARRAEGDADATLALDVYGHRLVQHLAAMVASAGGIDVLVFTGGVGEHAAAVRADALARLAWLDPALADPALGASAGDDGAGDDTELTSPGGRIRVLVVRAREDLAIARGVRSLLDR
jgi:acetate kinase